MASDITVAEFQLQAALYWLGTLLRFRDLGESENCSVEGYLACEGFEARFTPELNREYAHASAVMGGLQHQFSVHHDKPVGTWPTDLTHEQETLMDALLRLRIRKKTLSRIFLESADDWSPMGKVGQRLEAVANAALHFERSWGAYRDKDKKVTVADIQRLRSMSDIDKVCVCGQRVTARPNPCDIVVSCPRCGRRYLVEGAEEKGNITPFSQLKDFSA